MSTLLSKNLQRNLGYAAAGVGLYLAATTLYHSLNKFNLKGRVVLITGSSRGLGLVLARQLAAKGARLAICARTTSDLAEAKSQLQSVGADVEAFTADITSRKQVKKLVEDVISRYGQLDVLINNAGIIQVGPHEAMSIKDYEEAMNVNFWAPLYMIQAVLPQFGKQHEGRIVNITSIGGKIAVPHLLPYSASKFALVGLSEGLHAELKKQNIPVTTVVPNLMRTGSPRNVTLKGDHAAEYTWFKLSDSSPFISQRAESAAASIIRSLEYGDAEAVLSFTGKIATVVKGLAPGWVSALLTLTNKLLPENATGGHLKKKGFEVENNLTEGVLASPTEKAAIKNNEI